MQISYPLLGVDYLHFFISYLYTNGIVVQILDRKAGSLFCLTIMFNEQDGNR